MCYETISYNDSLISLWRKTTDIEKRDAYVLENTSKSVTKHSREDKSQTSYDHMTKHSREDQSQTSYDHMTKHSREDQSQTSYDHMTKHSREDKSQTSYDHMTKHSREDKSQTSYDHMTIKYTALIDAGKGGLLFEELWDSPSDIALLTSLLH